MKGPAAGLPASPSVEAVLFDLDGTLVDASAAISRTFNSVMIRFGFEPWSHDRVTAGIGRPLADIFYEVHPGCPPARLREMLRVYEELARKEEPQDVRLKPNVRETITWLSWNLKLGIVTSRRGRGALRILRRFELEQCFAATIGIEHVEKPKPDAQPLQMALQILGVPPHRALMVGDTRDDIRAAREAGVRSAAVTTGHQAYEVLAAARPDYVIDDLSEMNRFPELAGLPAPESEVRCS